MVVTMLDNNTDAVGWLLGTWLFSSVPAILAARFRCRWGWHHCSHVHTNSHIFPQQLLPSNFISDLMP